MTPKRLRRPLATAVRTALTALSAVQFTPTLLLTLYGGRLADRHDKRTLLTVTSVASGVLVTLLAVLVLTDAARLWQLYAFGFAVGVTNAIEVPTRMAFVSELVGSELLPNASALSGAYFNIAWILGPALAGLLITAAGIGPVMLINAASCLSTVAGLRMMRPAELRRGTRSSGSGRITDGLTHLRRRPGVRSLALFAAVSLLGLNMPVALPLMAKKVFRTDAASFGLLTSAFAVGSLLAALLTTLRTGRPGARVLTWGALVFGLLETAAGLAGRVMAPYSLTDLSARAT